MVKRWAGAPLSLLSSSLCLIKSISLTLRVLVCKIEIIIFTLSTSYVRDICRWGDMIHGTRILKITKLWINLRHSFIPSSQPRTVILRKTVHNTPHGFAPILRTSDGTNTPPPRPNCGFGGTPLSVPLALVLIQKCVSYGCVWVVSRAVTPKAGDVCSVWLQYLFLQFSLCIVLIPLPIYHVLSEVVFIGSHRWHLALMWHFSCGKHFIDIS